MAADASKGVPITTVALTGRVDLPATAARLKWPELRRYPYGSVYGLEGIERLYLFSFGAVVHDGADHLELSVLSVIESATEQRHLPETRRSRRGIRLKIGSRPSAHGNVLFGLRSALSP